MVVLLVMPRSLVPDDVNDGLNHIRHALKYDFRSLIKVSFVFYSMVVRFKRRGGCLFSSGCTADAGKSRVGPREGVQCEQVLGAATGACLVEPGTPLRLTGGALQVVESARHQGILLDRNLSLAQHYREESARLRALTGVYNRLLGSGHRLLPTVLQAVVGGRLRRYILPPNGSSQLRERMYN